MTEKEMLALKVGDMVYDCRYKYLKVKEIYEVQVPKKSLYEYFSWLLCSNITAEIYYIIEDWWPTEVGDKDLVLEDGAQCSAINCCEV